MCTTTLDTTRMQFSSAIMALMDPLHSSISSIAAAPHSACKGWLESAAGLDDSIT